MIEAAAITMDGLHEPANAVAPRVAQWMHRAAGDRASLVLFPETILGHYLEDPISVEGPEVVEVRQVAEKLGLSVGIGVGEADGDARYSSYLLVNPDGTWSRHRKTRWQTSHCPIDLGGSARVHRCAGLDVGVLICAECQFAEVPQSLAAAGAQVFIMPFATGVAARQGDPASPPQDIADVWRQDAALRARESGLPAILVGATEDLRKTVDGEDWTYTCGGGCALVDAEGEFIYREMSRTVRMHRFRIVAADGGVALQL